MPPKTSCGPEFLYYKPSPLNGAATAQQAESNVATSESAAPVFAGGREEVYRSGGSTVESASHAQPVEKSHRDVIVPLDQLEKQAILSALRTTGGNRTRTAELLKISIRTLRNKLQEYRASGDFTDDVEGE